MQVSFIACSTIALLEQNFLFTTKEENSLLKAIDFGLSDFVKPGTSYLYVTVPSFCVNEALN